MSDDTIKIRVVKPADYKRITDFVIKYYYGEEPLFSCNPKIVPGPRDLADVDECLRSGTSIMCYKETDKGEQILGTILSTIKDRSYVDKFNDTAAKEGNTKYGHYVRMLASIHRNVNICHHYNVDRFLYCFMMCVNRECRGINISHRLAVASMALAKRIGLNVYAADASSFYSAAVGDRLKMDLVNTLPFTDYLDEEKRPYFVVPPPHVAVKTYAARL